MGADKIAAFYDDPLKRGYDAHSAEKAFHLRALTCEPGLAWAARRALRGAARLAIGTVRGMRRWMSADEFAIQGRSRHAAPVP
jgi:hypothetical protein